MMERFSRRARNAALHAFSDMADAGLGPATLEVYDGNQPTSADDALSWNSPLALFAFPKPAFGLPHDGVIRARSTLTSVAAAAGVARWARIRDGNGQALLDIDVGTSGAGLNFETVEFEQGDEISIRELVLRLPA
jgi:hypothetical protein